jgi:glycosyltransferase involved in cell wall biosynthesis
LGAEALAEGTPVILMPSGGCEDWAQEGVMFTPRADVKAMAEAIRELEEEVQDAVVLGAAGKAWVEEHLSSARLVPERLRWLEAGAG